MDKCLLGDELTLNHLAGSGQLVLVFQLTAPSADEVYQKIVKSKLWKNLFSQKACYHKFHLNQYLS